MCGRITLATPAEEIAEYFQLTDWLPLEPRFNIAPTQLVANIRYTPVENHRELANLRWGLIPKWAEDLNIGSKLINARSETVTQKPAFREAFKMRRCLVIADGFYEWKRSAKQPYWIRVRDAKLFAMAGLWERKELADREPIESFTVLTTESNELIRPLHDRMPVILNFDQYDAWLDPHTKLDDLKGMLKPYSADAMCMTPVSSRVNDPKNEGAECLEPAAEKSVPAEAVPTKRKRRKGEDPNQGMLF